MLVNSPLIRFEGYFRPRARRACPRDVGFPQPRRRAGSLGRVPCLADVSDRAVGARLPDRDCRSHRQVADAPDRGGAPDLRRDDLPAPRLLDLELALALEHEVGNPEAEQARPAQQQIVVARIRENHVVSQPAQGEMQPPVPRDVVVEQHRPPCRQNPEPAELDRLPAAVDDVVSERLAVPGVEDLLEPLTRELRKQAAVEAPEGAADDAPWIGCPPAPHDLLEGPAVGARERVPGPGHRSDSWNPVRQLGWDGSQPSSRFAFSLDAPRRSDAKTAACLPPTSFASQSGTRSGRLAPAAAARAGTHSRIGAGSSSVML